LPPEFAARAKSAAGDATRPASPRDAATVVLVRDQPDGIAAYLVRRVRSMAFAPGAHVFPGGSVDPRDEAMPDEAWSGRPADEWAPLLGTTPARARALACAAARETFEESGVLLAGPSADEIVTDTTGDDWELDRRRLVDRSLSFADVLNRRALLLRADLLRPWARWITPAAEPRRFDARFFVAALPPGQRPRDVGGEADEVAWLRPRDALARHATGEILLLPPTAFTLGELSAYDSVAAVLEAGHARDLRPVLPKVVLTGPDEAAVLLPGDPGYDTAEPR
jgi:8-oxo-dGTP pyrophosphatase MutT (NUDIX family)